MLNDTMMAYTEIDEILSQLDLKYVEKIPQKLRALFKEEKIEDYHPKIDINIPLVKQNLKRDTIVILALLKINYWCKDNKEKQFWIDEFDKNEREKKELEEKYSLDNLFKNKKEDSIKNEGTERFSIIEYKKTGFIRNILNKILRLFKK